MDFVEQDLSQVLTVQSYRESVFEIDGKSYNYPIILGKQIFRLPEKQVADLTLESFQAALNAGATLIIIGTGTQHQFLPFYCAGTIVATWRGCRMYEHGGGMSHVGDGTK